MHLTIDILFTKIKNKISLTLLKLCNTESMNYPSCDVDPGAFVEHFPVHVEPCYLAFEIHTKFHGKNNNLRAVAACLITHRSVIYSTITRIGIGLRNARELLSDARVSHMYNGAIIFFYICYLNHI